MRPPASRVAGATAILLVALSAAACRSREPTVAAAPSAPLSPTSAVPDAALRVLVGGDVLPHRPRLLPPSRISEALAPLRPLFAEANATIANYETATGDPDDLTDASKRIALAAPAAWMEQLARAGVTAITAANNHACDLGEAGLDATIAASDGLGVQAIGVDPRDPWRPRVVAEKDGHRVCAVAWSTFVNEPIAGCAASGKIALTDFKKRGLAQIDHAIARARASGCDAVIAILHGGDEYEAQAAGPLIQARHAAIAGADAVVLHHPHVPSPVEVVVTPDGRRVPVFESVGNLVSNQGESWKPTYLPVRKNRHSISLNAWTRLGVIADLRWRWDHASKPGDRGALEWGYHLIWVDNEHAFHHDLKMPRIDARIFDPVADHAIQAKLSTDSGGPLALFDDPCWMESTGKRCR